MRVKFTIAICALLVLGLAVSQVNAQGYKISVAPRDVVASGNNQLLGQIRLAHRTAVEGGFDVVQNDSIEITFGGLNITNASAVDAATNLTLTGAAAATVVAANDKDTKAGKLTLTITAHGGTITIAGIRADVSGLDADDTVSATITSSGTGGGFVDITQTAGSTATGVVSTAKDGLNVTAVKQISQLTCDTGVGADRMPEITVAEGYASAWETNAAGFAADGADGASMDTTHIRIVVANNQSGVSFRWPGQGNFADDGTTPLGTDDSNYFGNPDAQMVDHDADDSNADVPIGQLEFQSAGTQIGDDKSKHWVVYKFEGVVNGTIDDAQLDHDDVVNTFKVSPRVMVDGSKVPAGGGVSDAWAQLWPGAKTGDDDNRGTVLSYSHEVETKDEGYFVNLTQCVTYLLYPFLTCGASADWTTGIAVANTSSDDEAFPVSGGAKAQNGSVVIYGYPKSTTEEKLATGSMSSPEMLADPISATISGNLAAGDTVAITCNMHPMLAGFEGYAIVRAGFRHGHGMAFVLGNFQDGAVVDVAHGYIALVIPDPEFGNDRAPAEGESLAH